MIYSDVHYYILIGTNSKNMKGKINWFNIITFMTSIFAVVIAYLSFQISKTALDYQISKDSFDNTPALTEKTDSLTIDFGLTNDSELQLIKITFPSNLHADINMITKPLRLHKWVIEDIANDYLTSHVTIKDSIMKAGTFSLPVMIDYSAIINGSSHDLRENRFLLFNFYQYEQEFTVKYSNSFLNSRFGFPIKAHYFWKIPFTELSQIRIYRQDSLDVKELLGNQLTFLNQQIN